MIVHGQREIQVTGLRYVTAAICETVSLNLVAVVPFLSYFLLAQKVGQKRID